MSEFKQIQSRMWQDNWFLSLEPEEKLLWIFLLTNQYSDITGLYELPKPLISPLTGIKDYEKILLKLVKENKICYDGNWIYIKNKLKHQPISKKLNDNIQKYINKYFEKNKEILANLTKNNKPLISPFKAPTKPLRKDQDQDQDKDKDMADKSAGNLSKQLLDYFFIRYKELTGKEPIITSWQRYNKQAQPFVSKYGLDKMKEAIELYFESEDNFIKNNGYPINIFLTDNTLQKLWK